MAEAASPMNYWRKPRTTSQPEEPRAPEESRRIADTGAPVDAFPQQVCVSVVPVVLGSHVAEHPTRRDIGPYWGWSKASSRLRP